MNRNDLHILVDTKGIIWLAQGTPALNKLPNDYAAMEMDLHYSQLKHRAVWRDGDDIIIGYPRDAPKGAFLVSQSSAGCTGKPVKIGRI